MTVEQGGAERGGAVERGPDGRLRWTPRPGDTVRMRSSHVCGADRMVVTRVGLDVRLACTGCGARVILSRARLIGRVADVVTG